MTPQERAAEVMHQHFGQAAFEPHAYEQITAVMAKAIADAIREEREGCAALVRGYLGKTLGTFERDVVIKIAADIRGRVAS